MAKRKLKKSVRNTIFLVGAIFTSALTINALDSEEHAMADVVKDEVEVYSNLEKYELNDTLATNYIGGDKAFFLNEEGEYSVFMLNDTKEKVYVKHSVLKESFANDILTVGDNVIIYGDGLSVKFVSVESGKSISYLMLTLEDYNDDYTKIVYKDEKTNETFSFDKKFIEANKLNNEANVGSMATGIVFDGEIVAVQYGW